MNVYQDLTTHFDIPSNRVKLVGNEYPGPPSSFKIATLSQGLISAVAAVSLELMQDKSKTATVDKLHSVAEFHSEQLLRCDDQPLPSSSLYPIGGHLRTKDGWVRVHDGYTHHIKGSYAVAVGQDMDSGRPVEELKNMFSEALLNWMSLEFEKAASKYHLPVAAVRPYPDTLDLSGFPVKITKTGHSPVKPLSSGLPLSNTKLIELNRVIAAPVCGKVLVAHGADSTWITSPDLPSASELDLEFTKGKTRLSLDLQQKMDLQTLHKLICQTDMFIQSYAPGSLQKRLNTPLNELYNDNPGIVVGTLRAFDGDWAEKKGFDSLVQASSGMNVSEGQYFGLAEGTPKVCPCQVLDHAAGYFLALGMLVSRLKQTREGGSYFVEVSLEGVMKYLRGLGQSDECLNTDKVTREMLQGKDVLEEKQTRFGRLSYVSHPIKIEGVSLQWDMNKWDGKE